MQQNKFTKLSWVGLIQVGCLGVAACSLAPFFSGLFWFLDLLSSFRLQYLILSVVFVVVFLVARQTTYAAISLMCVVINAMYVVPVLTSQKHAPDGEYNHRIKLFHANVYTANQNHDQLIQQVLSEKPDVVLLQEVNTRWMSKLGALKSQYTHTIEIPREDNFGIAVRSQIPIADYQIHDWTAVDVPSIEFELTLDTSSIRIISTHPPPPVNQYYHQAGIQQFKAIAKTLKVQDQHTVVIGDLNATGWSDHYPILINDTGLINASNGHGLAPTWPIHLLPFMIPIDHCLVSKELNVISFKTGESFGSDHLPLVVELGLNQHVGLFY